jgi:hypothetical protein
MQCVELNDDHENALCCPFCGVKIAAGASEENVSEWIVGNCEHLLFAGLGEIGFEYESDRFTTAVKSALSKKSDEEQEELEGDIEGLAKLAGIANAFMFQSMMGPPAQETAYIAFAPVEQP